MYISFRWGLGMASYNFSYTVAKGVYFCKDCLCKLSDLKKGGTHTLHPLTKYVEFSPDKMKFEMRTFRAVASWLRKVQRKWWSRIHNCEFSSLFRGIGPVILKTSCMPLHISLGVCLKVVNTVEEAAIVIDIESKPLMDSKQQKYMK